MTSDPTLAFAAALLLFGQLLVLTGLGIVTAVRLSRDPKVGAPILVVHDSAGVKPVLLALETGLLLVSLVADPFPTTHAAFVLLGAMLLTALSPGVGDRACGEDGVFHGWHGVRYADLEAWRLTGDHLRFQVRGEWSAVAVPRDRQARVRGILERIAGDRESPYKA